MTIPAMLAGLRTLANRWLIGTCTIQRASETKTSGGTSLNWVSLATGVSCSLLPSGAVASEVDDARGGTAAVSRWLIRLPAGQDVTEQDRILVGGRTFEVQGVQARTFEVRRTVNCVEIE